MPSDVNANGTKLTPRGARTRGALVEAARKVFERDGFLDARITDISEAAGVAHGSFYTYFTSKEEAFRAVIIALQEQLLRTEDQPEDRREPRTMWDAVLTTNRHYLRVWRDHAALMRLWEEVATLDVEVAAMLDESRSNFVRRAQSAIARMQTAGGVDERIDPRYAAYALTGMVSRFAYVWFARGEDDFDFDTAVEQLTRLWMNALGIGPDTLP